MPDSKAAAPGFANPQKPWRHLFLSLGGIIAAASAVVSAVVIAAVSAVVIPVIIANNQALAAPHSDIERPNQNRNLVMTDLVLKDEKRGKELEIKVVAPSVASNEKLPVIIFSHGVRGSAENYAPLTDYFARHGYICIKPTHQDSFKLMRDSVRNEVGPAKIAKLKELLAETRSGMNVPMGEGAFRDWASRPQDISFIIDKLSYIESCIPILKGRLDAGRVGIAGHSFGAHTVQVTAGMTIGGNRQWQDPRPLAFLCISPQGTDLNGADQVKVEKSAWQNIERPLMVITGTADSGRNGQPYTWRTEPYTLSKPPHKYLLVFQDAGHNMGGISGNSIAMTNKANGTESALVERVARAACAFFDLYLKGKATALTEMEAAEKKLSPSSHFFSK
ncbi:MAG: Alpha/beta hydrolase family protein [bacterium ADurb.Bin425]|nr:MAG: Alpha/beta hydrolase family protein [bacterium ADurb.Bin425]